MMKTDSVSSNPRRIFAAVILAAGSLCLLYAAQNIPAFADWYTAHVYSILVETLGRFWGIFPFSAVEFGLYLAIFVLILSLIYAIRRKRLRRWGANVLLFASILFFTYTLCCGINYGHKSFSVATGITTSSYTAEELASVCELLTNHLNRLAPEISCAEDGTSLMGKKMVPRNAKNAMEQIGTLYDELDGYYPLPKRLTVSEILSYQNLSGIYSPFTIEANYNDDMTETIFPLPPVTSFLIYGVLCRRKKRILLRFWHASTRTLLSSNTAAICWVGFTQPTSSIMQITKPTNGYIPCSTISHRLILRQTRSSGIHMTDRLLKYPIRSMTVI